MKTRASSIVERPTERRTLSPTMAVSVSTTQDSFRRESATIVRPWASTPRRRRSTTATVLGAGPGASGRTAAPIALSDPDSLDVERRIGDSTRRQRVTVDLDRREDAGEGEELATIAETTSPIRGRRSGRKVRGDDRGRIRVLDQSTPKCLRRSAMPSVSRNDSRLPAKASRTRPGCMRNRSRRLTLTHRRSSLRTPSMSADQAKRRGVHRSRRNADQPVRLQTC